MQKKWIVVLCVVFGLLAGTFVFVEAKVFKKPVAIKKTLKVLKSVTIGTKNNLGKLFVKGEISNPVNGEKVVVNDDLSVKNNLDIYGDLRIFGNYEKVTIISTKDLADESVTTSKLAKKAVTTAKIDDKAVTDNKIDSNAVTSAKIDTDAVTTGKIKAGAVNAVDIADGAVTNGKLAADSVTTEKIANYAIVRRNIDSNVITDSEVDNLSSRSFLKAGAYITNVGVVIRQFNLIVSSGPITAVAHPSTGIYTITIDGLTSEDFAVATIIASDGGEIEISNISTNTLGIVTYDSAGAKANKSFNFMVY